MAVTWILDFDYDFTAPETISHFVESFVILPRETVVVWPEVKYPCVAYGTMRKMMMMVRQPGICEAVFDDYVALRCSHYYRYVYPFLGRRAFIVPFAALRCVEWRTVFGERMFVRPDSNAKPFDAAVVEVDKLVEFAERYWHRGQNELVVVSEVVDLGQEYRCFCRNGRVFCNSSYPEPPYRRAPQKVIDFAQSIARVLLDAGFSSMLTIDIAEGDVLRLVEIGGVNSWGIYGGSVEAFVLAMEKEALERQQDFLL